MPSELSKITQPFLYEINTWPTSTAHSWRLSPTQHSETVAGNSATGPDGPEMTGT